MIHLDSIYRNRYQEYYLCTQEVADSRKINWRQVEWEKVISIKTYIHGRVHTITCQNPNFKFFLNFRWGGAEPYYQNGSFKGYKPIKIWCSGWSDGKVCYLQDYDFKTGFKLKEYTSSLSEFKGHIHPRIINLGILKYVQ